MLSKVKMILVMTTTTRSFLCDPECPNLVAISVYDTKPVNILTMACANLEWVEKQKKVWDKNAGATISMKFLRPGVINDYNNGMNNVDQAD